MSGSQKKLTSVEECHFPGKSLLTAGGCEPERELIQGLDGAPRLTLCGNCRQIHPMIEGVIKEGKAAGESLRELM